MNNLPFVSICVPVFNGEIYLKECLDSCVTQTYNNYEIIICDDGSSDKTISIVESYKDSKIKFFKNDKNLGLVGNWNKCIEVSSGDWIKFVFQDDFITKDCLEKFVSEIKADTILLACKRNFILPKNSSDSVIDYYANQVRTLENTGYYSTNNFSPKVISKIAIQNICMNFIGEPSLIMFKKSICNELGLFNPALKQICDLDFALRIASKYGLSYIPEKLCAFRVHANSTTSNNVSNSFFELHYIEPVLFSYLLLFDSQFTQLRKQLAILELIKLRIYFNVKVYRAASVNKKENYQYYLFRKENITFPEIAKSASASLFTKILSKLL